jgi:hypothetical protein
MKNGYGTVSWNGKRWLIHRAIWTETCSPIPAGLTIDHLCRNKVCVNVRHMEVVTLAENSRRAGGLEKSHANARTRTHCKRGHEYTPENTHLYRGSRSCKRCDRTKWREWAVRNGLRRHEPGFAPAPCGTRAGYMRHRRNGEDCTSCREAHAAYNRRRRGTERTLAPCGTPARYERHRKARDPRCEPCWQAHADAERARRARARVA